MTANDENHVDGIVLVSADSSQRLNVRQETSYREHRRQLVEWMLNLGKAPSKAEGYAQTTANTRAKRLDLFYRWVWDEHGGYTEQITPAHADAWMKHLAHQEFTTSYKACCQKAVKTLFKWQNWEHGRDVDWDPVITYTERGGTDNPRDFLTREERQNIREASLEYGSIPHYHGLSVEERDRWKTYLAQRFQKPKSAVTKADWDKANSFKVPSLVWASMDAGLRPIEVGRATVSWVDAENGVLRIPKEDSSKNEDNWVVSLLDRTAFFLQKWLDERDAYDRYEGSDKIWLTRHGNPYASRSLNYILQNLCDMVGIETENRDVTWYSIRHSVGTYMAREEGLAAA